MGNSIFDDDDDGFTLTGGIEGEEPKSPRVNPVSKTAPARPEVGRRATGIPPAGLNRPAPVMPRPVTGVAPKQNPSLPKAPALPVQKMVTKPSPTLPAARKPLPSIPAGPALPKIPPAVYAKPEESYTETVLPASPIELEKSDISYTDEAEESLHENYRTPVDYEEEERAAKRAERRAAEKAEERKLERLREQERLDRLRQEREDRLYQEKEKAPEPQEIPARVLSRKESAALKREEEKNKREERKNKGKGKNGSKSEKPAGNYAGNRNKVLILRIVVFSFIAIFAFAGMKATFFPTKGPTANNVIATAKFGLGITKFPTDQGSAFVLGFSKVYLTIQKDGQTERNKQLAIYAPANVITAQQFGKSGGNDPVDTQVITAGPYVSGVVSKTDELAVYTVSAQVNNERWVYMDVPVYYDLEAHTFAISGAPSFVPAPEQAKLKPTKKEWTTDDLKAVDEFLPDAKLFFAAWADSKKDSMAVHTDPAADTATKTGLAGAVKLKEVSKVSIQPAEEAKDPTVRKARVTVVWDNALVPGTTYSQSYDLTLVKKESELHWKIRTLTGGIPVENAS